MPRATLHNRQDSLERALQLFWRKGFHATSLKDLEKALDMRPGSIYAAFGSKDALFQESLERYAHMALRELQRTFSEYDSPLLGLAAYLRQLGKLSEQEFSCRACLLVKSVLELGEREHSARQKANELLTGMENCFTQQFAAAQHLGELDTQYDPARLGRRFQADVMGLRAFAQRDVCSSSVHALAEDMAQSVEALMSQGMGCKHASH